MLRAILFDLGDTLIDFEPMDVRAVFREAARHTYDFLTERGFALPPFQNYCRQQFKAVRWAYFWAKCRGREFNSLDLLRSFCTRIGAPLDEPTLLELAWLWYEPIMSHSTCEDGLPATLAALKHSGLRLGLVSNTFVAGAVHDRHLDLHGLLDLLPVRIYSSDVGYRKPDRRIYAIALDKLGVSATEAMFVGDLMKTDIVGARRLGMTTVLKQPWGTARSHRRADYVIRQIADLREVLSGFAPIEVSPEPLIEQFATTFAKRDAGIA